MKRWIYWLGILLSLLFLYLAIRGLDLNNVWLSMRTANPLWFIPGLGLYFLGVLLRSFRWSLLLKNKYPVGSRELFPSICIGYLGNNVFPARAGEFLRAYHLKEKQQVPFSTSLASIIVERIFDGLVMIIFILIGLPFFLRTISGDDPSTLIQWILGLGSLLFITAFLVVILFAIFPQKTRRIMDKIFLRVLPQKWHQAYQNILQRFLDGVASLQSITQIASIMLLSIAIWLLETGLYWSVQQALGLHIPFTTLLLLNGALNLIAVVPSAPGYIGVFDAPGISLLSATGMVTDIAAAYILTLHAILWLPITIVGFYFFLREGLEWSQIKSRQQGDE